MHALLMSLLVGALAATVLPSVADDYQYIVSGWPVEEAYSSCPSEEEFSLVGNRTFEFDILDTALRTGKPQGMLILVR